MSFELLELSEDYKYHRLGSSFSEENIDTLFLDINKLVLFTTSLCNFSGCEHCAVDYPLFRKNNPSRIMDGDAAIELSHLISPAQQFSNSGGEVLLLDEQIRNNALENNLISEKFAQRLNGANYLEQLLSVQTEKVREDYDRISNLFPILAGTDRERFVRIPTNAYLLPWLINEGIDLDDSDSIRESKLYGVWRRFPGTLFVVSVGSFQEQEYDRVSEKIGKPKLTLVRRVKELVAVSDVLRGDYGTRDDEGKLVNFGLGFVYTYSEPKNGDTWEDLDRELTEHYGEHISPQRLEENPLYNYVRSLDRFPVEDQHVKAVQRATCLPGASFKIHSKKELGDINELYAVPFKDGKTIGFYEDTLKMYSPKREQALFVIRHN